MSHNIATPGVFSMWRRIQAEGCEWEVRATSEAPEAGAEEILEFMPLDDVRPPRRFMVPSGTLSTMDDTALEAAFRQARPIGADFYGRPGKRMGDVSAE